MSSITKLLAVIALVCAATSTPARADDGHPVAVRWWGQGFVTIETFWNLRVAIDPYSLRIGYDDPGVSADVVLITHEHGDHNNVGLVGDEPEVVRGLDDDGDVKPIRVVLDRHANAAEPTLHDATENVLFSSNAVRIRSLATDHDDDGGAARGHNAVFIVEVDGVKIVHCGDLGQARLTDAQIAAMGSADVLLMPAGGVYTTDPATAAGVVASLGPRIVIPIHYKTDALEIALDDETAFVEALPSRFARVEAIGNTVAVSKVSPMTATQPSVVTLKYEPWSAPEALEGLLAAKEKAAAEAAPVFAKLATNQMNHKPSNGTHTPRWNVEHMAGRELLYFSQIYHGVDPVIPAIDHNPAQMPPDYVAAHPDWTGAEEARRIERVQAFTRRFSYLLADLPLDELPEGAPGFARSLEGLFQIMAWHWPEHTGNTIEKFSLEDWPDAEGE